MNLAVRDDSNVTAKATKLAIVDLEKDDTPEVILWLVVNNDDYYGSEVLRYRSFIDLKADGTFSCSSGAADYGFGTVKFAKKCLFGR